MSAPTASSWEKPIRVVKYLKRCPRMVFSYNWQDDDAELQVYSDANWAGCQRTRKSTPGGVIMKGGHLIKAWSRNQNIVALSSAESEFHATVKAAMEGIGMISMAASFGDKCTVRMHVDASAALGVIQRKGIGKISHLHTGALWLQEQQVKNVFSFKKINGTASPADWFTKHLSREAMDKYSVMLGAEKIEGRSDKAAQLHHLQRKVRQLRAQVRHKDNKISEGDMPDIEVDMVGDNFIGDVKKFEQRQDGVLDEKYQDWLKREFRLEGLSRSSVSMNGHASTVGQTCSADARRRLQTLLVRGGVLKYGGANLS